MSRPFESIKESKLHQYPSFLLIICKTRKNYVKIITLTTTKTKKKKKKILQFLSLISKTQTMYFNKKKKIINLLKRKMK